MLDNTWILFLTMQIGVPTLAGFRDEMAELLHGARMLEDPGLCLPLGTILQFHWDTPKCRLILIH